MLLGAGLLGAGAVLLSRGRANAQPALSEPVGLIQRNASPIALEAPLDSFRNTITTTDRFFIRYNLPRTPDVDDLKGWALKIGGDGMDGEIAVSMEELRALPMRETVAVCQSAGNRRSFAEPKVPGVQWGIGGMGCAKWRGVRLREVLQRINIKPDTIEVALVGADSALNPDRTPYVKSLPLERALDAGTLIAFEMNGAPLPLAHGYPARIVRPGWAGTYWMKHLTGLELRTRKLENPFMAASYRLPRGLIPTDRPYASQEDEQSSLVTALQVNALVTNVVDADTIKLAGLVLQGVAWDGGSGVQSVELSFDGGTRWRSALLGPDPGRYAFRGWRFPVTGVRPGVLNMLVRATGNDGQVQPERARANPGGFLDNAMQKLSLLTTT